MMQQLKPFDFGLAALIALVFALLGYYALSAARDDGAAYETDLLALGATDAALSRDLHRLETGALNHFDTIVAASRALRRIENRLNREPAGLGGAREFAALRLSAAILLGEKLVLVEEFKTALAEFKAAMDFFPELSTNRARYTGAGGGLSQEDLTFLLSKIAEYVQEPTPALEETLRE
ncbi:MAG: hypothetical protein Q8N51_05085, partial [Gammaproteobacteria bacterium]|nr:hypothetical protein [Gammaproteobacteria bacterium]